MPNACVARRRPPQAPRFAGSNDYTLRPDSGHGRSMTPTARQSRESGPRSVEPHGGMTIVAVQDQFDPWRFSSASKGGIGQPLVSIASAADDGSAARERPARWIDGQIRSSALSCTGPSRPVASSGVGTAVDADQRQRPRSSNGILTVPSRRGVAAHEIAKVLAK